MVVYDDLTIEVALADPMIDLIRRADGIDRRDFAALLRAAAYVTGASRLGRSDRDACDRVAMSAPIAGRKTSCGSACAW